MTEIPHYLQKHIYHLLDGTNTYCLKLINKYGFLTDYMMTKFYDDIISFLELNPEIKLSKIYIDINTGSCLKLSYLDIIYNNLRRLLIFLISKLYPIRTLWLGRTFYINEEDMMIISRNIPTLRSLKTDCKLNLTDNMTSSIIYMITSNVNFRTLHIQVGSVENNNNIKIVETLLNHHNVTKMIIDSSMFLDVESLDQTCDMISNCKRIDDVKFFFQLGDKNSVLERMDGYWVKYFMVDCQYIKTISILCGYTFEMLTHIGVTTIIEHLRHNAHIRKVTFDSGSDGNYFTRGDVVKALKDCNFCLESFNCQFSYYNNNISGLEDFLNRNRANNTMKDTSLFHMMYKNMHLYTFFDKRKNNKRQRVH